MTDVVSAVSRGACAAAACHVHKTRRYSCIATGDKKAQIASLLGSAFEARKREPVQQGWQREVGLVPQSAFSEGLYRFKFKSGETLDIPESFEAIGSRVWDCAPCMARWFEKGNFVRGKTILELGAGTGLLGLACAKLGAAKVILTDLEYIRPSMERSIKATGLGEICVARALDWNDPVAVDALNAEFGPFDMIVASDVLVFAVDASTSGESGLVRALTRLAIPGKTEILMGCNKNRHGFLVGFYAQPPTHLFNIETVSRDEVDVEFYTDMLMLYRMYLKN